MPLQTGVFLRHIGAQLLEAGQHPHHVGAGQGGAVLLEERLAVELLAPLTERHRFKQYRQLPGLVADGERGDAPFFKLVGDGDKLGPAGGRSQLVALEHLAVEPQPVDPVDAGGHRHQGTILAEGGTHHGRHLTVPAEVFGHRAKIAQKAEPGPLLEFIALEVGRFGRVGRQCPALQYRHGALAAAALHCKVVPLVALFGPLGFEHFDRFRFAAGCPPVQHFHLGGGNGSREQGDDRKRQPLHKVTALVGRAWPAGHLADDFPAPDRRRGRGLCCGRCQGRGRCQPDPC